MSRCRPEIMVALFLIASVLAVYGPVRDYQFINFDDNDYITENRHVQAGWTQESFFWAFTTRLHRHWHPLTWLSHMTDCQLFGLNPGRHHLTSVFLHLASTLLLFFVFRQMTGAVWRSGFLAALFALHPLHVEPVAWVADRKDVLSTFFWMLTIVAYVRYAKHPGFHRYALVFMGFILGLMAKSVVITLPVVLLLLDYWPLERFESGPWCREGQPQNRTGRGAGYQSAPALRLVREKAVLFLVAAACAVVAVSVMRRGGSVSSDLRGLWPGKTSVADSLVHYVIYMARMFWPVDLATPYPDPQTPSGWQVGGAGLVLLSISFLVFWRGRRHPYLPVGWLWYLLTLLPAIGLVKIGPHVMADRYAYVPLIGLFVIIAWGVPDLLKKWRYGRIAIGVSAGMLLFVLMVCTRHQVGYWKNSVTLLTHTVNVTADNWQAQNNLGVALRQEGRLEEAIRHYSEALRINPAYVQACSNMGIALAEQGKFEEAIRQFSEALRMDPDHEEAHYNLGVALARQGKLEEAIRHFSEALRIKPRYGEAHYNLGVALAKQGKLEEAIRHFSRALRIRPNYAMAHNQLGIALASQGKLKEAIRHFSEALRIRPNYATARYNMERALRLMRNSTEIPTTLLTP